MKKLFLILCITNTIQYLHGISTIEIYYEQFPVSDKRRDSMNPTKIPPCSIFINCTNGIRRYAFFSRPIDAQYYLHDLRLDYPEFKDIIDEGIEAIQKYIDDNHEFNLLESIKIKIVIDNIEEDIASKSLCPVCEF